MENFKCLNCGKEMEYNGLVNNEIDFSVKDGKMWIVAKWECLECRKMERIEFTGNMTKIDRNV